MSSHNDECNRDVDLRTNTMSTQWDSLQERLREENRRNQDTGGVSFGNRRAGFIPAFRDELVGCVYLSRFTNGELAPIHILDSLPKHLCRHETDTNHPTGSEQRVTSGFVRGSRFFTRAEAASWIERHTIH